MPRIEFRDYAQTLINDAGGAEPLTGEEEIALGKIISHGTQSEAAAAVNELVCHNVRFVIGEAQKLSGYGHCMEDMVSDGLYGLYESAQKFDYRLGNKFISYAVWGVRQKIKAGIAEASRPVRIHRNTFGVMGRVIRAEKRLESRGESQPTADEVAEEGVMPVGEVMAVKILRRHPVSLDTAPTNSDSGAGFAVSDKEMLPDATQDPSRYVESGSMSGFIGRLLGHLKERERVVVQMRFGIGYEREHTLVEIGDKLGVSRERVRQLEAVAFDTIVEKSETAELLEIGEMFGVGPDAIRKLRAFHVDRRINRHARRWNPGACSAKTRELVGK